MAATPGTTDYYNLPAAQRKADYQHAVQSAQATGEAGSTVPVEAYLTPAETAYIQALSTANLQPWQKSVTEKYPSQAPYLNDPEIASILKRAVDEKWLPAELQSNLQASAWWKARNPAQRAWHLLNNTDPAAALQSVQQQMATITQSSHLLGLNLNAGQLMTLSVQALSMGWTETQLNNAMIEASKGKIRSGTMGATRDQLKATADDYLMPISDHSLDTWTKRISSGEATPDVFKDQMSRQAMGRYQDPGIKEALQHGMTIREFADPYVQQAAQTLGLNPNDVDLLKPKWSKALDHVDESGKKRAMTMDEWDQKIKLDPTYGYDHSKNGIAEASQLVSGIRQQFGFQ